MSYTNEIENQIPKAWHHHLAHRTKGDKVIWALVVLLALISMLVVYSATGSLAYKNYKGNTEIYLFKQVAFIMLGIGIIYFAHRVNYIKNCTAAVHSVHPIVDLHLVFWVKHE